VCAALAASAGADRIRPGSWDERLRQVEALVEAGRWKQALPMAERLVGEMAQGLASGEAATRAMASSVALLALAEAGLGRDDDATWHWSFAVSLRPELAATRLDHFGAAGELLERSREAWEPPPASEPVDQGGESGETPPRGTVEPPRKRSAPDPQGGQPACGSPGVILRALP
jgi:hypothetical protein